MGPVKVFLDANILFSAALGGSSFALIWDLARADKVILLCSRYCLLEAERNLSRKRPAALSLWPALLESVTLVPDENPEILGVDLPEKDMPVYAAAVACGADVLLTGDTTHFGHLMDRDDLAVRVFTVRRFLLGLSA